MADAVTDAIKALADAMGTLFESLGDHEVLRGVAGTDAVMDLGYHEDDPSDVRAGHDMARSAEDIIDDLHIRKISSSELTAAEKALEAYLHA